MEAIQRTGVSWERGATALNEGTSIPYEYQSKIFDKFVQVDSDQASGGTGKGYLI